MGIIAASLFLVSIITGTVCCSYYVKRIPEGTLPADNTLEWN